MNHNHIFNLFSMIFVIGCAIYSFGSWYATFGDFKEFPWKVSLLFLVGIIPNLLIIILY